MSFRESGSMGKAGKPWRIIAGAWLILSSGCLSARPHIDEALLRRTDSPSNPQEVTQHYRVGCPDVLELNIDGADDWRGVPLLIGVDGRIDLGPLGRPRIEGLTAAEIATLIANQAQLPGYQVHVRVSDYRSQKVYIFGQVKGQERAVPFRGQETVLELLQRVGGITAGAEPSDVYVLRAKVADGGRPELFPINLRDIVMKNNYKTNLPLEPGDQIYIGETRRSSLAKCVPPMFRPIYESLWGLYRAGQDKVWPRNPPSDNPASGA
jgi:protein involved in polysaccharide export with SLBB domain